MKKIAIVGASLALAALPMVGAFADNPPSVVDTITITVSETCTFTRTTGESTYTATMAVNALNPSVGTSTFTAICNNASGFSVSATPTALSGTGEAITYSATTPQAGDGTWTATKSGQGGNIAATGGVLMTANGPTAAAGQAETVTYKVSTRNNQAKGDYTGRMTYALTQNTGSGS